ncbi:MAG: hypothetical protein RLZZ455_996, partial [Candidatus Parcubacteria bacterium]
KAISQKGQHHEAAGIYTRIHDQFSEDRNFLRDQARTFTATAKRENVKAAITTLEALTETNDSPIAGDFSLLALAYGRAGRYERSLKAYQKALSIDPALPDAQLVTIPAGEGSLEERTNTKSQILHKKGQQLLFANHQPLEALRYYEAAIALVGEAKAPWSIFDKGKALSELGLHEEAIQALQQSRFLMPDSTWPSSQLGIVYEKSGKLELAQALFYEALQKDNKNHDALSGLTRLGVSYEHLRETEKARALFRTVLNTDHTNREAAEHLEKVGNVNELGLLKWEEHAKRRSPTLSMLPDAILDEKHEATRYIESFSQEYRDELTQMNASIGRPMDQNCRVAISIPAYQEGRVIKTSLEHFLGQKDANGAPLDPSLFEIVIVDNHPDEKPRDDTEQRIREFQEEHPEIRISYIHKAWKKNEGSVGNARRYGLDLATLRGSERNHTDDELILVNNDADIYGVSPTYIHTIINQFDTDPKLDAITGKWTLPDTYLANPNLKAAQRLKYIFDLVLMANYIPGSETSQPNPPKLQGKSSAFRTSIYAAIGGMNKYAKLAEDLEIGWMIRGARGWKGDSLKFVSGSSMAVVSDPRRFLAVMADGVPLANMYEGFHENTKIREMDNDALLAEIPEKFDREIFESNADALWQKQRSEYKYQNAHFYSFFSRTMRLMGAEYEITDRKDADGVIRSHIKILDTTRLEKRLSHSTKEDVTESSVHIESQPSETEIEAARVIAERKKTSEQLFREGKTLLEFRQEFSNDYSALEALYKEKTGVDLNADPYESADHPVQITKSCSIVLPTYKRGEQLTKSLAALQESSFNAKYPQQLEVIVIDDGTPEDAGEKTISQIVQDLNLKDLTVKVYRQTNGRISKARYSGALRATGDIVIITDPDVVYTPNTVEEFMKRHEILDHTAFYGLRANISPDDQRISLDAIRGGSLATLPYAFNQDSRITNDAMIDSNWMKDAGHNRTLPMDAENEYYGWTLASSAWGLSVSAPREALLKTLCGLEERYVGWGYNDEHMVSELIAAGLFVIPNTGGIAYHQEHPSVMDPEKRKINRGIFDENLASLPKFQDPLHPKETDAELVFEVKNSRNDPVEKITILSSDPRAKAWTQLNMGHYEQAILSFEQLLPEMQSDTWLMHDYATALTATSQEAMVKKAIDILLQCINTRPSETWHYSALGTAYGRIGEYKKGLDAFRKARQLFGNNQQAAIIGSPNEDSSALAHSRKEKGSLLLKRNKPREALEYLEAALMLDGEKRQPWAVFDKGKALSHMGLYHEAILQLRKSAELLPHETWPFSQLGSAYEAIGEKERAKSYYEQALTRWSENEEARQGLTRLLQR